MQQQKARVIRVTRAFAFAYVAPPFGLGGRSCRYL